VSTQEGTPFRLVWFTAYGPRLWDSPDSLLHDWRRPERYRETARVLEQRGGFDALVLADTTAIAHGGTDRIAPYVEYGLEGVYHDPMPMLAAVAGGTRHLGVVATLSTELYPPYILARALGTLDTLSGGRAGWNIVTSSGAHTARLYGRDALPEHEDRYDRADEFVEVAKRLWEAWEPDAVVMDHETGRFADPAKVHSIDFEGERFSVRGPLTLPRSPQGVPVICQAGSSPRGKRFAAEHAEMIIVHKNSVPLMKEFREDVRRRLAEAGRDPDSCKVFFTAHVVVGETRAEARAKRAALHALPSRTDAAALATLEARMGGVDLTGLPLDEAPPEHLWEGPNSFLGKQYGADGARPTLREIARREAMKDSFVLEGTAQDVADQMAAAMDEIGGDGFAVRDALLPSVALPIVDRVVPILRERGLVRTAYHYATMRDNLLDPHFAAAALKDAEDIA